MPRLALILALCMAAFASLAWASDCTIVTHYNDRVILSPDGHLDDPEADTLYYDDDTEDYLYFPNMSNYWEMTRFTVPTAFQLRSIYFAADNTNASATACSVWVYTASTNSRPGTLLARAVAELVEQAAWIDVTLPTPVDIAAGSNFMVIVGRAPGYSTGWYTYVDGASSTNRSYYNTTSRTTNYNTIPYDWRLRVGGEYAQFMDVQASECFNSDGSGSSFHVPAGASVTLKAQIKNVSNLDAETFSVNFSVRGPDGSVVHTTDGVGTTLAPDASQTVIGEVPMTCTAPGEYFVTAVVSAEGDSNTGNDSTYLRFFAGANPMWYRYDDNTAEGSVNFTEGQGIAVGFAPSQYSARVESLRVFVPEASEMSDVRIYTYSGDAPGENADWQTFADLVEGWNTVPVSPPVSVFMGQKVAAAYFFTATSAALSKDNNAPNVSAITNMGTTAYQYNTADGFTPYLLGNWCLQVFMDSSSALPPFPIIAYSADTLFFGQVDTTGSHNMVQTLWVHNLGASENLIISPPMNIMPVPNRSAFTIAPTTLTVAAGDSEMVTVTFNPIQARQYNSNLIIMNNSNNAPIDTVFIRAQGVALAVEMPEAGLPNEFALAQNYPNPFNPTTEIRFSLPQASQVRLSVYNMLGQEVAMLVNETLSAGVYTQTFDASKLPAGIYFYRMDAGSFSDVRKMLLLK